MYLFFGVHVKCAANHFTILGYTYRVIDANMKRELKR